MNRCACFSSHALVAHLQQDWREVVYLRWRRHLRLLDAGQECHECAGASGHAEPLSAAGRWTGVLVAGLGCQFPSHRFHYHIDHPLHDVGYADEIENEKLNLTGWSAIISRGSEE